MTGDDILSVVKTGRGARVEFPTSTLLLSLDESAQVIGRIEYLDDDYEDLDESEVIPILNREELVEVRFQENLS